MTPDGRALLVALSLVLAGCGGGGPGPITASAPPVTVAESAAADAGYEFAGLDNRTVETTVQASISGDVEMQSTREVTATTPVATYRREADGGPALVAVVASPAVRPIEGQDVFRDPLATLSTAELVAHVQGTYEVEDLSASGERPVTLLGNETTLAVSTATATLDGESLPVTVAVASVRDGETYVTVVAVAPEGTDLRLDALVAGIER